MQNVSQEKYRQLQAAPIGKLLLQYSIPAIINMAVGSFFKPTDSIFIGNGVGGVSYTQIPNHANRKDNILPLLP